MSVLKEPVKLRSKLGLVLYLRSPAMSDLDDLESDLNKILSMSEVGREDIITTPLEFLEHVVEGASLQPPTSAIFLIVQDNTCIGYIGFSHVWTETGELSVRIRSSSARQGIGTEAIKFCINYGFKVLGFKRIFLDTSPENDAMKYIMQILQVLVCEDKEDDGYKIHRYWIGEDAWINLSWSKKL